MAGEIVGPAAAESPAALLAQCPAQALDQTVMALRSEVLEFCRPHGQQLGKVAVAIVGGGGGPCTQRCERPWGH